MKVLLLGRPGLFENLGGDRIQIENTAKELNKLGVETSLQTGTDFSAEGFDLVHVFQLDWNPYCFFQIKKACEQKKPVVLSPIHHNIQELTKFDEEYTFGFRRLSKLLFKNQYHRDLLKELYRALKHPDRLPVVFYSFSHGLKNMYTQSISASEVLLVQTKLEAADLKQAYGVNFRWVLVKNGVSDMFLKSNTAGLINPLSEDNYVICVGRIEPRKNQLSIIKAMERVRRELKKDIKLVLVGAKQVKNHPEYINLIEKEIKNNSWIIHISQVPYDKMPAYYKFAKVSVSASWFETTGLTSLEGLICGSNAVASGERAKEYLGDYASYCKPDDIESIKNAIIAEYNTAPRIIPDELYAEYTWSNTARKTLEVYNGILNHVHE